MDPRQLPVDKRLLGVCVFCGGHPDTRDHVPSKVFLDKNLPEDLPVVEACAACNQSFSLDEEYLACFLEAVLSGTDDPNKMKRMKIRRTLYRNQRLVQRLEASLNVDVNGNLNWTPEHDRVRNVVLKLAQGHAAYELSFPLLNEPKELAFAPFITMSEKARADFERVGLGELRRWAEIGSRAFRRDLDNAGPWIEVQPMRYRYSVDQPEGVIVRIVLGEYLACQVVWE